jgi:hypothetical protein
MKRVGGCVQSIKINEAAMTEKISALQVTLAEVAEQCGQLQTLALTKDEKDHRQSTQVSERIKGVTSRLSATEEEVIALRKKLLNLEERSSQPRTPQGEQEPMTRFQSPAPTQNLIDLRKIFIMTMILMIMMMWMIMLMGLTFHRGVGV